MMIEKYIDKFGLVQPNPDGETSQNGTLFTAYWCMSAGLSAEDAAPFVTAVKRCELVSGLFCRSPENPFEQDSVDNYLGIAAMALAYAPEIAERVCFYGASHHIKAGPIKLFWYMNNEVINTEECIDGKKNWQAWLGRFPAVPLLFRLAAGRRLGIIDRALLLITVSVGPFLQLRHEDPFMQTATLIRAIKRSGRISKAEVGFLEHALDIALRLSPHQSLADVFGKYFGKEHPIYYSERGVT